jgi:hypothetical protein
MRRTLALLIVVIGIAMASAAAAEPRDSVDRGDGLDTNALRDDFSTNRLKAPSHPLVIAPPGQAVTEGDEEQEFQRERQPLAGDVPEDGIDDLGGDILAFSDG